MSGDLRVESEYGKGSTFFLEIPRISKEEAAHKEASLQPASVQYHQPQQQAPVIPDATPVEPPANPPAQPPTEQPQQPTEPAQVTESPVQPNQPPQPQPTLTNPEHATLADIEHHLETSRRAISIPRRNNNP
jgi:carbohydrate-binding protein, putative